MEGAPDKKTMPGNVTHYKVIVPDLCDIFWAVLVLILQEYFEDPKGFKIVIFGESCTPAAIFSLLSSLELNTELIYSPSGQHLEQVEKRENALATFKSSKSGICFCDSNSGVTEMNLPSTQAIQIGLPIICLTDLIKRMWMIHEACESTGKTGRFMTITTAHEIASKDLPKFLQKTMKDSINYCIDFSGNATLFRQRFNQHITEAFAKSPLNLRHEQYWNMVKRHRRYLIKPTESAAALLQDLHQCAVIMGVPKDGVLQAEHRWLVKQQDSSWVKDEQAFWNYENMDVKEALRVLHITAAVRPTSLTVKAEVKAEVVMGTGANMELLGEKRERAVQTNLAAARPSTRVFKAEVMAKVVDLTGDTSGHNIIDLTMED